MKKKLTLSIDREIIEAAKAYTRNKNTSLSHLIENYLLSVTTKNKATSDDISPLVKSLSGVIKLDCKANTKTDYANYLVKKYR
jgi:hypothetical protein